jgi:DNA-binding response OmpR family regulator
VKVLVVHRDAAMLLALERVLLPAGHDVMWVDDAREALDLIAWPDALVTEARAGGPVARLARLRRPELSVLVM